MGSGVGERMREIKERKSDKEKREREAKTQSVEKGATQ